MNSFCSFVQICNHFADCFAIFFGGKKMFKEKHAVPWSRLEILSQVDLHCFSWALRSGFKFSILSAPSLLWFNPAMFIHAAPYIWSSDISPLVRIPRNTEESMKYRGIQEIQRDPWYTEGSIKYRGINETQRHKVIKYL